MDIIVLPFLLVLHTAIKFYIWVVIIGTIVNQLIAFNLINVYHPFTRVMADALYRLTEPALKRIRKFLPFMAGLDLSPLVLIFALHFIQGVIHRLVLKMA